MSSTVTIIGSEEARTKLESSLRFYSDRTSLLWEPRLHFNSAEDADYVAGLRFSLKQQGLSKNTAGEVNAVFKAILEAGTATSEAISYASASTARDTTLRLPEVYRQNFVDRDLATLNFAALTGTITGPMADMNLKETTFERIREALKDEGLDVTEGTPLSTVLYSQPESSAAEGKVSRWVIFSYDKAGYVVDVADVNGLCSQ